MTDWRDRLKMAERRRGENSAHWMKAVPALFRDHLAPAAEEFCKVAGAHVTARLEVLPAENKIVLGFDDWHVGEWSMTVQLIPTTLEHAWVEIACPPAAPRRHALARDVTNPKFALLEWMTEAYLDRTGGP